MKSLKSLNKFLLKYKYRLLLGALFVTLSNIFGILVNDKVGKAFDYIIQLSQNKLPNDHSTVLKLALTILGFAVLSGIFMFLMRQMIIVMSRLIEYDQKNELYAHYQALDQNFYKQNSTGDLMNRISEDVSAVRMYTGPAIMYLINTLVTSITVVTFMNVVNTKLTLIVLAPLPILSFIIYRVSDKINKKSLAKQATESELSTLSQETYSGIRVIKAYNRESVFEKKMEEKSADYLSKGLSLAHTEARFYPFIVLMIGFSTLGIIYFGGRMAIVTKEISPGQLAEFILNIFRLTWPFASLGWVTSLVQRAAASQQRINQFLDVKADIKNENNKVQISEIKGKIEFKNVYFKYNDAKTNCIHDISFTIEQGKTLAIIGHTGSGKSTIANLMCRLHDVSAGEILIDNQKINHINLFDLRQSIGYVPQEVFLFSESISNNIAFSVNAESFSAEKIEQYAEYAAIKENIQNFPEGFKTLVGERGITLSGGQKQRVSIARALAADPKILILDDCLSAIDTETEEEILFHLKKLMHERTSIIISHRISSVKHADEIIVLNNGEIVERGTHETLIQLHGLYHKLNQLQKLEAVAD
jgi:ATP-binding cassette, subfamily B, multidrug efflux pump